MKSLYSYVFLMLFWYGVAAQDYSLNPTNLNVQGSPGDFMLSTLMLRNTSSDTITMHLKRILKDLPSNWESCFCFPRCMAPFIDTLTFTIPPFSMDSIKPNYSTDSSTAGIGYITITLYQEDFPNKIDTISFSGSTVTSGINNASLSSNFGFYPNPFCGALTVKNDNLIPYSLLIYNSTGEIVYRKEKIVSASELIDLEFLSTGVYYLKSEFTSGKIVSNKIIKSK